MFTELTTELTGQSCLRHYVYVDRINRTVMFTELTTELTGQSCLRHFYDKKG
jgi:hypothetical protein